MFYEDNDILVARFGTGDIRVCPGHEEGTHFGTVSLVDGCGICRPINEPVVSDEEWVKIKTEHGIKTDVNMNTMIRMVFEKPESIDCMIWALEEAKKQMDGYDQ